MAELMLQLQTNQLQGNTMLALICKELGKSIAVSDIRVVMYRMY